MRRTFAFEKVRLCLLILSYRTYLNIKYDHVYLRAIFEATFANLFTRRWKNIVMVEKQKKNIAFAEENYNENTNE